jgi:hypothetical protein
MTFGLQTRVNCDNFAQVHVPDKLGGAGFPHQLGVHPPRPVPGPPLPFQHPDLNTGKT